MNNSVDIFFSSRKYHPIQCTLVSVCHSWTTCFRHRPQYLPHVKTMPFCTHHNIFYTWETWHTAQLCNTVSICPSWDPYHAVHTIILATHEIHALEHTLRVRQMSHQMWWITTGFHVVQHTQNSFFVCCRRPVSERRQTKYAILVFLVRLKDLHLINKWGNVHT